MNQAEKQQKLVELKPGQYDPRCSFDPTLPGGHELDAGGDGVQFCKRCEGAFVAVSPGLYYVGVTIAGEMDWQVFAVDDGERHELDPRFDLFRHSPDGFAWGYGGSGPAQLSLAIVSDFVRRVYEVGPELAGAVALRWYQLFKRRLGVLDGDACFVMGAATVKGDLSTLFGRHAERREMRVACECLGEPGHGCDDPHDHDCIAQRVAVFEQELVPLRGSPPVPCGSTVNMIGGAACRKLVPCEDHP